MTKKEQANALAAEQDKTMLDLLRLCPEGVSSKSLTSVLAQWPHGNISACLRRLHSQGLIEARAAVTLMKDGGSVKTLRWHWVVPAAYRHRYTRYEA